MTVGKQILEKFNTFSPFSPPSIFGQLSIKYCYFFSLAFIHSQHVLATQPIVNYQVTTAVTPYN